MSSNGQTYVSTVFANGSGFYKPSNGTMGSTSPNGSGYRVTDMYYVDIDDKEQIERQRWAAAAKLEQERLSWSWRVTIWNVLACLLCPGCIYCMFGALLCNIFAYVDHRFGDHASKQRKVQYSIVCSVGAFIASIIVIVVILIVLFAVYDAAGWTSIPTYPGSDFTM